MESKFLKDFLQYDNNQVLTNNQELKKNFGCSSTWIKADKNVVHFFFIQKEFSSVWWGIEGGP